jgi:hypothetical protein
MMDATARAVMAQQGAAPDTTAATNKNTHSRRAPPAGLPGLQVAPQHPARTSISQVILRKMLQK